jgi:hypothetical protein|tara:strand:- start:512 stop:649 length:138 start_codon:yes stop_codon:yes gene_type:complete
MEVLVSKYLLNVKQTKTHFSGIKTTTRNEADLELSAHFLKFKKNF